MSTSQPTNSILKVAGIGASAGGLHALEKFLRGLAVGTGGVFVVIQHLSPKFESHMVDILGRASDLEVKEIEDGLQLTSDTVFVLPPGKIVELSGDRFTMSDRQSSDSHNHPIDIFFHSLALNYGEDSIAVVLSGTGSDGTDGAMAVHEVGGVIIAQDPRTSQFSGMPASLIAEGRVDNVLAPEDIGAEIYRRFSGEPELSFGVTSDEVLMTKLFELLRQTKKVDFAHYRANTRTRRLQRRMDAVKQPSLAGYIDLLEANPLELDKLFDEFLISVTRFFRDPGAFDYLETEVLPALVEQAVIEDRPLRIWTPGTASGEEAYSIAILIDEYLTTTKQHLDFQVFATDVQANVLAIAEEGVYSAAALADLPPKRQRAYFSRDGENFRVVDSLRENIVFAEHDLMADAPFSDIDIVVCRNLLIYFAIESQETALSSLHTALRDEGVLFLGSSETTGTLGEAFAMLDRRWRFFKKHNQIKDSRHLNRDFASRNVSRNVQVEFDSANAIIKAAQQQAEEFQDGTALVVDAECGLLESLDQESQFLGVGPRRDTNKLFDIVLEDLKPHITNAFTTAAETARPAFHPGVRVEVESGVVDTLDLVVRPIVSANNQFLVTIDRAGVVSRLGQELATTRKNLQDTDQELETANEELQSSNEELVTANEELQSSNEELHSVNEELFTVNTDYKQSLQQLAHVNADMDNVLSSTGVGVIFLDADFSIRRFTPEIADVFQLRENDVGASLVSICQRAGLTEIVNLVREIRRSGAKTDLELDDLNGKPYLLRIAPYVGLADVAGYVFTTVEIGVLRDARRRLEQFQHMSEQAVDGYAFINSTGGIEYANPVFADMSGYSNEELLSLDIDSLVPGFQNGDGFGAVLAEGWEDPAAALDTFLTARSGHLVPVDVTASRMLSHGEENLFLVVRDATARKDADQQLILLKHAIDVSHNGVTIAEAVDGFPITYVNDGFLMLTGYQREDVLGRNCRFLQGEATDKDAVAKIHEALKNHEQIGTTLVNYRADGSWFWNSLTISPVFNSRGGLTHFVGLQEDVTESVREQQQVEQNALLNQAVLESTGEGIYGLDKRGVCTFCNKAALQLLGFASEDEVVGQNMHALIHHSNAQAAPVAQQASKIMRSIERGKSTKIDSEVIWRSDGTSFPAEYWCDPLLLDDDVSGAVVVFRDISSRKEFEQNLLDARQAAESANAAKNTFLANISHEIRTPLAAVMGFTDVLRAEIKETPQLSKLDAVKRNALHLLGLMDDLLDLSKVEAGRLELRIENISIDLFLVELHQMIAQRALDQSLDFDIRLLTNVPLVFRSDPVRLRQILLNLLANALKFTPQGKVELKISYVEGALEFAISDTGVGIEDSVRETLFEPFVQGPSAENRGGSGLGLSICQRLAEELDAQIGVESVVGQGSVFTLRHPVISGSDEQWISDEQLKNRFAHPPLLGTQQLTPLDAHILVADDQADVRDALKTLLTRAGATVVAVADGAEVENEVLGAVQQGKPFDVVVLDMQMPLMTGYEAASRLRDKQFSGKILALTARAMPGERDRCLAAGCDEFLAKPVDGETLTHTIESLMNSSSEDSVLDTDAAEVAVLVVEDHADTLKAYEALLSSLGCIVTTASTAQQALDAVALVMPDFCMIDQHLPDMLGSDLMLKMRKLENCSASVFAAVTGDVSESAVQRYHSIGFDHHIAKPVDLSELQELLKQLQRGAAYPNP